MSGRDRLHAVGQAIGQAARTGGARYVTGVTTSGPASGWISVDIGDQIIRATIPGSFRGALAEGQEVRLSVQGTLYTVDSVLSALPTPALDDAGGEANEWSTTATGPQSFIAAGYSTSGFTAQDFQNAYYGEYLASYGRAHADDINDLKAVVNDLVAQRNTDRALLAQVRALLISQGLGEGS